VTQDIPQKNWPRQVMTKINFAQPSETDETKMA
jgi:hypothetical protein